MNLTIRTNYDFSGEIVSLCKMHNISKNSLAKGTGMTYRTICRIFDNQNPRDKKEPYNLSTQTFHKILMYIRDNYDSGIIKIDME